MCGLTPCRGCPHTSLCVDISTGPLALADGLGGRHHTLRVVPVLNLTPSRAGPGLSIELLRACPADTELC